MIESLVNRVASLPPGELAHVSLEDITLCAAWLDPIIERDSSAAQKYQNVRQTLDLWVQCVEEPPADTEGVRQQPLLRVLLNEAVRGHLEVLARDEVDFLFFCYGLAVRTNKRELFARPLECLEPYMEQMNSLRARLEPQLGLPNICERIGIYSAAELKQAEPRDVRVFAGLDIQVRGPVLLHHGDLKIIDEIPAGVAVVVEDGSCYVNGPVAGMLAATRSCEVLGNISGVVVSRRGAIRCKSILNQATVISKEGQVACVAAEDPRLIFAGKDINVRTGVLGGRLFARDITVGSDVLACELQVSTSVNAGVFRNSEEKHTTIVLRRGMTCQDYGELLLSEASRLMTSAIRISQRRANLQMLLQITAREADEIAGNVLLFLLGEDDSSVRLQEIQDIRRKAAFIDRLLTAIRGLVTVAELRLAMLAGTNDEAGAAGLDERSVNEQLQRELAHITAEGGVDPALFRYREDIAHLGRKLSSKRMQAEQFMDLLRSLVLKHQELREMREPLEEAARTREQSMEKHSGRMEIMQRARTERNQVQVLEQLIATARKRGRAAGTKFTQRINDRFLKLMRRNIEHRQTRLADYRRAIEEHQQKINDVREKLWTGFQVSLPDHVLEGWNADGAVCRGRFDEGVWVCSWNYLVAQGRPGDPGLLIAPGSGDEVLAYRRNAQGQIVPLQPAAH